jgi:nitrite reductase (NO-forming)/hydroxylamine reductase
VRRDDGGRKGAGRKKIYFERCAGCHGVLRKGATGKNLEPHWTKTDKDGKTEGGTLKLGTTRLEKIIALRHRRRHGELRRHPDQGRNRLMARYIQNTPDVPPEFSLKDTMDSWKVIVPVKDRPTKQMNKINLKNVFSTTLRDTGEVALIDGDTKRSAASSRPAMPCISRVCRSRVAMYT